MADNNNQNAGGEQNPQANQPQGSANQQPQNQQQGGEQQPTQQQPAAQPAPQPVEPAPTPAPEPPAPQQPTPQPASTPAPTPASLADQIANFGKPANFELPQGVSDRTKEQFDKLTENNKKLLESNQQLQSELNQRLQSEQRLQPLQNLAQPQTPDIAEFVVTETDPATGTQYQVIDDKKLQSAISKANDRAVRAEQQMQNYIKQQQAQEDQRQAAETYKAYPQLRPGAEQFDAELNKITRRIALDSMMNPQDYGGSSLTFKDAADLANEELTKLRGSQPQQPQPQAQPGANNQQQMNNQNVQTNQPETTSVKEQGGLTAQGQPAGGQPTQDVEEDLERLRSMTRRGGNQGMWAVAQRLQHVDHYGTPTSKEEIGEE